MTDGQWADGVSVPPRSWPVRQLMVTLCMVAVVLGGAGLPTTVAAETEPADRPDASTAIVEQAVTRELATVGRTDFWVTFEDQADLSEADKIDDWAERGQYVYDQLTATAKARQADLIDELREEGAEYESFWITNTVLVRGGDQAALDTARLVSGVAEIRADEPVKLPDPIKDKNTDDGGARVNAVEWGIANIRADQVWSDFGGVRGEGIVVGNIDSGVEYTHPALVGQYRGNVGDGAFEHDYNWWDPSQVCGSPSVQPCDNNGHGTHTMGTMIGDDGAGNQVGVAPGATWIAAKGCEGRECSLAALLSSGQFMLAPTKLDGTEPDPALRPNIINNSWGEPNGSAVNPFYREIVTAWTAAGIFGVFANGNFGPGCDTTGSPADYVESWGVGAYDSNNTIWVLSSRGPGENGEIRPSISAPGVNVRSSYPGDQYVPGSGTSMASPHVSGAVALMWSAAPDLIGDITGTREILANTAVDTDDTTCGGAPENNNVYGQGRLDAFAAVLASPRGPVGSLTGIVTDSVTDASIADAIVSFEVDGSTRSTATGADGAYTFPVVEVGTYEVTAEAFGYNARTQPTNIVEDQGSTLDFALDPLPAHKVSGQVLDGAGRPVANATVTIEDTPIAPVTTDLDGVYEFSSVPGGTYSATAASSCSSRTRQVVVSRPTKANFMLPQCSTWRVSVASDGSQANGHSLDPVASADGRFVVFRSDSSNLVPGDTNGQGDIFVHDRTTGTTERVSMASDGTEANNRSETPFIDPNGRFVAFWSRASNLVPGDTNGQGDIFVHDRTTGATERVSVASDGAQGNQPSVDPSMSADGRFVVFLSYSSNLVPGDTNGTTPDIFVHDRKTGATERVSVASDGTEANSRSGEPFIDPSGRLVAFVSPASNLVPGDTNGRSDVFVHDRTTGATERVSVASDGTQATGLSLTPALSADGHHVAFISTASNLVPGDTNGQDDTFVHDRTTGVTERVSVASDGTQANDWSLRAAVSADARYVAFWSSASNLVPGDTNGQGDIFVHDRTTGATERVSVASDGTEANERPGYSSLSISADGRYVMFDTAASNLVPGDTNEVLDVFVHDRSGPGGGGVPFDTLRDMVAGFAASGDVTRQGEKRLSNTVDQAERFYERGRTDQAITKLETFRDLAANPLLVTTDAARDALVDAAQGLIDRLSSGGTGASSSTQPAASSGEVMPI